MATTRELVMLEKQHKMTIIRTAVATGRYLTTAQDKDEIWRSRCNDLVRIGMLENFRSVGEAMSYAPTDAAREAVAAGRLSILIH